MEESATKVLDTYKVIYIRLAIMTSLLVDNFLSILPQLWFPTLESAANLKWREILNGRKRQTKRIGTNGERGN